MLFLIRTMTERIVKGKVGAVAIDVAATFDY